MTGEPAAGGAERADAVSPAAPPERRGWRGGMRSFVRNIALYLALLIGAAVVLGGASAVARQFGFDVDGNRFARVLMLGVYVIGAVAMMRRAGR